MLATAHKFFPKWIGKSKKIFFKGWGLLFIFIISSASSCDEKNENILLQDMVEFDKAFIPVLYYVRQGEIDNAKKSVFFLNHSWQRFEQKYKNVHPQNDDWQEAFRMTTAWLSDAYISIDAMMRDEAFIFLDHVRYQFMELRLQNNIDYFLDDVWDFEASLDLAEEVAVDQMLCLLEYCEFEELVADLNDDWRKVRKAKVNAELFEMDADELKRLKYQKKKLQAVIKDFNQAVEEAEGENLAMTITFVRVAYLDYLACFGDFISSKHYYATT